MTFLAAIKTPYQIFYVDPLGLETSPRRVSGYQDRSRALKAAQQKLRELQSRRSGYSGVAVAIQR